MHGPRGLVFRRDGLRLFLDPFFEGGGKQTSRRPFVGGSVLEQGLRAPTPRPEGSRVVRSVRFSPGSSPIRTPTPGLVLRFSQRFLRGILLPAGTSIYLPARRDHLSGLSVPGFLFEGNYRPEIGRA